MVNREEGLTATTTTQRGAPLIRCVGRSLGRTSDANTKFLQKQVEFLDQNKEVDVCYGELLISNVPNQKFEFCGSNRKWPTLEGTLENQLRHNSPHCLPMWRKSIHDDVGLFDTKYFSAADYDMWFKVLKNGGKLAKMDEIVGLYYENPTSISRNKKTLSRAISEVNEVRSKYLNL